MRKNFSVKKAYVYFFVFLAVFLYGFQATYVFAHESEDENTIIIHVTEQGFLPRETSVEPGTTVLFENAGESAHWPASNDHPSHTLYDGTTLEEHCTGEQYTSFDSCEPIERGTSWSFVFRNEGVFEFHDHIWSHLVGTIVVERAFVEKEEEKTIFTRVVDYIKRMFSAALSFFIDEKMPMDDTSNTHLVLKSGDTRTELYTQAKERFVHNVIESDPREAISALRAESQENENIFALCHDILHELGRTAYEKYGSFQEAVQYQNDFCNSGYIHGLFESYFEWEENPEDGLVEQCFLYASGKRAFDLWQCYHGTGHGFMYFTGGDLDESLHLCEENLPSEAAGACQNGVYMEVFNAEVLAQEAQFVNPENPFATCAARNVAPGTCYLYVPTYFSQTLGYDFPSILQECGSVDALYRASCISGVAAEAIKRNMDNPDNVFALCRLTNSFAEQHICVDGVVGMYMQQEASYTAGVILCETAHVDFKDTCEDTVSARKAFFE